MLIKTSSHSFFRLRRKSELLVEAEANEEAC